ncbi:class II aldolase/adducin family protein [Eoetvoesiella caeni]|uniref:HCOMODA/2-hydroxy-3-carboxy-muconic semialdehyde decarboxylase n=1 Tax=Eoetvoesiella caeni TaxID=645616 RepID=A0A366HBC8_9BURK|nr:class II aldolase/adducin family protein [Eoetvoesiella caeni]MCI2809550.1 class II aldolase/adducin family protein [Eoetvoesiella caeni]NYT56046.1 class II aldolase/adducin family protein [Eoetvoesiella caeni]RBP38811.1 HCOMODA/2-hydroxy-3-carboxy-muconic semialdehyde decarboxylase [Eoetvoesiella caeni]
MCSNHDNTIPAASSTVNDSAEAPLAVDPSLIQDLVFANHILFDQGVLDAFGHVSMRHPDDANRFLLCRNMAPAQATVQDIVQFQLDGTPIDAAGRPVYLERFIHGELYKARPDVMAVVHSHSPSVVPFSVVKEAPLRPLCHMAGFIGAGAPIFEIRDVVGDGSSLLVTDNRLGAALAASLAGSSVVLMRGHGSTVVADTLKKAVYRAVYTEINARAQLQASQLGAITFLSPAEAQATTATIETQVGRAWDLWKKKAEHTAGYLR